MGLDTVLTERFRREDDARVNEWMKQATVEQQTPAKPSAPAAPTIANDKAPAKEPTAVYDPSKGWVLTSDPNVRVQPDGFLDLLGMAAAASGERIVQGGKRIARGLGGKSEPLLGSKSLGELKDVAVGALQATFFPSAAVGFLAGEAGAAHARWSGEMSDEALQARLKHARLNAPGEVLFYEALLLRPYEERIDAARAGAALPAEVGSGAIPGYTVAARGVAALVGRGARGIKATDAVVKTATRAQLALNPAPPGVAGGATGAGEILPASARTRSMLPAAQEPKALTGEVVGERKALQSGERLGEPAPSGPKALPPGPTDAQGAFPMAPAPPVSVTPEFAQEVVDATRINGGATADVVAGRLHTADRGFAVSIEPERGATVMGEPNVGHVGDFVQKNADAFADPRARLGTWRDEDGVTHFDISIVVDSREEAVALARQHNQRAIYDFGTKTSIDTTDPVRGVLAEPSTENVLRLEHYSPQEGLGQLDPGKHGTGQAGAERRRIGEPGWLPRTYAYVAGAEPEARFAGSPFKYDVEVPKDRVYDFEGDPRGIVEETYKAGAANGPAGMATQAEANVRAAGYAGYRVGNVVALFEPSPVVGATVRVPGAGGQSFNVRLDDAQRRIRGGWLDFAKGLMVDETGAISLRGSVNEALWDKNQKLVNDLSTVGAAYLWTGARSFTPWSKAMTARFGTGIQAKLPELYQKSQETLAKIPIVTPRTFRDLEKMTAEGAYARDWYDGAREAAREHFGKENGDLYLRLYAATSPQTAADTHNSQLADEAYKLIISGKRSWPEAPFKAGDGFILGAHTDNLNRVLRGEPLSGPKVTEFEAALLGNTDAVPMDSWMARAFGWSKPVGETPAGTSWSAIDVTPARAKFGKEIVHHLADRVGLEPRGAQAAIWAAFKIRNESNFSIAKWTDLFATWRKAAETGNARPSFVRDVDSLPEPEWVKNGFATDEAGRATVGSMVALGRAAVGAALAGATGDDPESMAMNALLGAGLGLALGPTGARALARTVAKVVADPDVSKALSRAWDVMTDETGAMNIRFPRGVHNSPAGRDPMPNTGRMDVADESKRLVRGINEKLEAAGKLARSSVVSHDETIQAALKSQYTDVNEVLKLDVASIAPDKLPAALVASRNTRDFILDDALEAFAQAKLAGDPDLAKLARQKFTLAGAVSKRVTDLQTWVARAQESSKIMSRPLAGPHPTDLDGFAKELAAMDATLAAKLTDSQLIEMVSGMVDRAQAGKLAETAAVWPDALWSIYYGLNMLSSPVTHAKNVLGDMAGLALSLADRAAGEAIELVTLPFAAAGVKNRNIAFGETYEMIRGVYEMIADSFRAGEKGAWQAAVQAYKTGDSALGAGFKTSEGIRVAQATLEQDGLPTIVYAMAALGQKNMRLMGGTDEFFKVLSFHAEGRALARRRAMLEAGGDKKAFVEAYQAHLDNPDADMLSAMTAAAHENTYTKAFEGPNGWRNLWGLGGLMEQFAHHPIMRVTITPFFRTPTRLAEFSTVHTPLLNAIAPQFWSDIAAGGPKAQLAFAKIATGAGVFGLASWYAAHGLLTGDWPNDPKLKAAYERAGWQPFSVYNPTNGKYYNYKGIEPLSTILAVSATYTQMAEYLPDHELQTMATAMVVAAAQSVFENPYFQGISELGDIIQGSARGENVEAGLKFVARRLSNFVPFAAVGRTVGRALEDEKREMKTVEHVAPELREVSRLQNEFLKSVPGYSKTLPAKINIVTGEPIPMEGGWLGAILPYQVTTNANDPVLNKLVELGGAGIPVELPRVIDGRKPVEGVRMELPKPGEGVLLSDIERSRLGVLLTKEVKDGAGRTLYGAFSAMIVGPGFEHEMFKDASDGRDGGKSRMLEKTFNAFLASAELKLKQEAPHLVTTVEMRRFNRQLNLVPKSMEGAKPGMQGGFQQMIESLGR